MRSTRNIFIVNMAVSGVLLCSFTMPLTLVDLLYKYWVLGTDQVLLYKYWALGTDQVLLYKYWPSVQIRY